MILSAIMVNDDCLVLKSTALEFLWSKQSDSKYVICTKARLAMLNNFSTVERGQMDSAANKMDSGFEKAPQDMQELALHHE